MSCYFVCILAVSVVMCSCTNMQRIQTNLTCTWWSGSHSQYQYTAICTQECYVCLHTHTSHTHTPPPPPPPLNSLSMAGRWARFWHSVVYYYGAGWQMELVDKHTHTHMPHTHTTHTYTHHTTHTSILLVLYVMHPFLPTHTVHTYQSNQQHPQMLNT